MRDALKPAILGSPREVQSPLGAAWDDAGNLLIYDIGRHRIMRLSAPRTLRDEIEVPPEVGGPVWDDGGLAWTATTGDGAVYIEPLLPQFENVPSQAAAIVLRWKKVMMAGSGSSRIACISCRLRLS